MDKGSPSTAKHRSQARGRAAILGVGGSPRRRGNSDVLVQTILAGARAAGGRTRAVQLRDVQYQPCIGCEQCRRSGRCTGLTDGMGHLYPMLEASRGLVLVSPTHNYNVTAWMKAFIDRLYCYYSFDDRRPRGWTSRLAGQGRKAVLAAVCEQEGEEDMGFTLAAMRRPLEALGYAVLAELPVYAIFDRGGVKHHPEILRRADGLGRLLAEAIAALAGQ
jgi:multimeric flavodoxin WrbA